MSARSPKISTAVLRRRAKANKTVSMTREQVDSIATELDLLRSLLIEAEDAFAECTGDYADELTSDEDWRIEAKRLRKAPR